MNEQERAAFIQSQSVCALIEALGMVALNMQRQATGNSMAYSDTDFDNLIIKYGIGHNVVIGFLTGRY